MTLRDFAHGFAAVAIGLALLLVDSEPCVLYLVVGLLAVAFGLVAYADHQHYAPRGHWWRYRKGKGR